MVVAPRVLDGAADSSGILHDLRPRCPPYRFAAVVMRASARIHCRDLVLTTCPAHTCLCCAVVNSHTYMRSMSRTSAFSGRNLSVLLHASSQSKESWLCRPPPAAPPSRRGAAPSAAARLSMRLPWRQRAMAARRERAGRRQRAWRWRLWSCTPGGALAARGRGCASGRARWRSRATRGPGTRRLVSSVLGGH